MKHIRNFYHNTPEVGFNPKTPFAGVVIKIPNNKGFFRYYETKVDDKLGKNEIQLTTHQAQDLQYTLSDLINPVIDNDITFTTKSIKLRISSVPNKPVTVKSDELDVIFRKVFLDKILFSQQSYYLNYNNIKIKITNISGSHVKITFDTEIIISESSQNIEFSSYDNTNKNICDPKITISPENNLEITQFTKKSLQDLGIGGLQHQFDKILRRIFASRLLDPQLVKKFGLKHVKGLILYGPPGTGKTLLSRQFSQLITNVEPVVVNGPEIKNKYVGASEENLRKLFDGAVNDKSNRVHVIIFDEIDAICRQRGSSSANRVDDSLVNQLLTMMDGIKSLNNILVIGLTNRLDLLDTALLRPGRFELHLRIGLPDLNGRKEIFQIYLNPYYQNNCLNLGSFQTYEALIEDLSQKTSNYSGAEIDGIIKSAVSFALDRKIDWEKERNMVTEIELQSLDLERGLNEVKPQWSGCQGKLPEKWPEFWQNNDVVNHLNKIDDGLQNGKKVLIIGAVRTGKTQLLCGLADRIGKEFYTVYVKNDLSNTLRDVEIVQPDYLFLDDLLDLVKYIPLGCRYNSDLVLQLKSLLKTGLSIVATSNDIDVVKSMGLADYFELIVQL